MISTIPSFSGMLRKREGPVKKILPGDGPFYYLSDFKPIGAHSVLFLAKDDDPVLLITSRCDEDRAKKPAWIVANSQMKF
jgi:hypothetical protein